MNQPLLTGELYPAEKLVGDTASGAQNPTGASDAVFAGTSVISGTAAVLVCLTGQKTALGDFGTSFIYNQLVGELLQVWGVETLKIQVPAIMLSMLLATAAGVVAATRQQGWADFTVVSGAMLGHSIPGFLIGIV